MHVKAGRVGTKVARGRAEHGIEDVEANLGEVTRTHGQAKEAVGRRAGWLRAHLVREAAERLWLRLRLSLCQLKPASEQRLRLRWIVAHGDFHVLASLWQTTIALIEALPAKLRGLTCWKPTKYHRDSWP